MYKYGDECVGLGAAAFENEIGYRRRLRFNKCAPCFKKEFSCPYCSHVSLVKCNMNKHIAHVHGKSIDNCIPKNHNVFCQFCLFGCNDYKTLAGHYRDSHNLAANVEDYYFETFERFEKWKKELETETWSKFVLKNEVLNKDGTKTSYYRSNRTGCYVYSGAGVREIGGTYPAFINVKQRRSGVYVSCNSVRLDRETCFEVLKLNRALAGVDLKELECVSSLLLLKNSEFVLTQLPAVYISSHKTESFRLNGNQICEQQNLLTCKEGSTRTYEADLQLDSVGKEFSSCKRKRRAEVSFETYSKELKDNGEEDGIAKRSLTKFVPLADGTFELPSSVKLRLLHNIPEPEPDCSCHAFEDAGPYYTHLGAARDIQEMKHIMQIRSGFEPHQIRIENVTTAKQRSEDNYGCPVARQIIRRRLIDEKLLCVVRHRKGHTCATSIQCIAIVYHDGVDHDCGNALYELIRTTLPKYERSKTFRRAESNKKRNCGCQGMGPTAGSSYSFGCSYSPYEKCCKFSVSASPNVRRFKLQPLVTEEETALEVALNNLADAISATYEKMAPVSFANQNEFTHIASQCRLGSQNSTPFSGITVCLDYSAHPHYDKNNMLNGSTVVVSLNKHRMLEKTDSEQFHVLPLYKLSEPETESESGELQKKVDSGEIEFLSKYHVVWKRRSVALPPAKERLRFDNLVKKAQKLGKEALSKDQQRLLTTNNVSYHFSDCETICSNKNAGGLALSLCHGSILFEVAGRELHATTAVANPDQTCPTRISLVFYQHRDLNEPDHCQKLITTAKL